MATTSPRARRLAVLAAVTAAGLVLAACSSSGKSLSSASGGSGKVTTVQVGITGATAPPTFLPLIATKMGLDVKNGLQIKFVTVTPAVTAQALTKGSVDILAAPSVETATLQGAPFKIIAGAAKSYWRFFASNSIQGWAGLAGKKIALPCGEAATCHSFIINVLNAHHVDPNSVTFIYGTAQATYESLAAGSVDGALTTAPYTYALATAGKTTSYDISDTPTYLSTQFTATTSYIKGHTAVVDAFVKTMVAAEAIVTKLPVSDQVLSIINAFEKANGIDPTTLNQQQFLTEFANDSSWQLVPTRALITEDLTLIKAIPDLTKAASSASFDNLVYMVPEFAGQYG